MWNNFRILHFLMFVIANTSCVSGAIMPMSYLSITDINRMVLLLHNKVVTKTPLEKFLQRNRTFFDVMFGVYISRLTLSKLLTQIYAMI